MVPPLAVLVAGAPLEIPMASLRTRTRKIRNSKNKKAGSARKTAMETKGTTPVFPIHKDGEKNPPNKS